MAFILFLSHGRSFWRVKIPKRVVFLMWVAVCGWILIVDNLIKKGFSLANWCCMCRCSGKTVDHLLLHHDFSHELWSEVYVWDLVGDVGDGSISFVWLVELVWKTCLGFLEFGASMFDLVLSLGVYAFYFKFWFLVFR